MLVDARHIYRTGKHRKTTQFCCQHFTQKLSHTFIYILREKNKKGFHGCIQRWLPQWAVLWWRHGTSESTLVFTVKYWSWLPGPQRTVASCTCARWCSDRGLDSLSVNDSQIRGMHSTPLQRPPGTEEEEKDPVVLCWVLPLWSWWKRLLGCFLTFKMLWCCEQTLIFLHNLIPLSLLQDFTDAHVQKMLFIMYFKEVD